MDKLSAKTILISNLFEDQAVKELAEYYNISIEETIKQLKCRFIVKESKGRATASIRFFDEQSGILVIKKSN